MFENLIESKPKKVRTFKQSAMSLILHLTIGYAAIKATAGAAEELHKVLQDTTAFVLKAPEPPPPPPEQPPPDAVVTANPPPLGFQTVMPPTEIPKDIPPVNLNEKFNAADFSGKGVEGGVAGGVAGGTGPVTGETFLQTEVDDPVQPINIPKPRFPPVLQSAGVSGFVDVTYVVDTLGHAEPSSWKVQKSSNQQFEAPAREAIMKGVFKPARIKGGAVRQLVQQKISFNIGQ
ncbi:MAG TPA: TonB family protein [Gemmatimonadales bacterium]|jgi:protein TonB|nr:TonB family protein [Gemmatimonadales bacterium]